MDIRTALKQQYHAGLAMLAQCVERCPDDLWTTGPHPRAYWLIVMHAAFFTQLYMGQDEAAFQPWPGRKPDYDHLWHQPAYLEPYELPEGGRPFTKGEVLDYLAFIDLMVDSTIDTLDLDRTDTGFPWYKNMSKLSHELMNLRHIQGHIGQLSELLMARGIDIDWVGKADSTAKAE